MKKILMAALAVAAVGGMVGCDSPTETTTINVTLTAAPDPAPASRVPEGEKTYSYVDSESKTHIETHQYKTTFVVTAKEEDGHPVDITSLDVRVQQASGGIVITPPTGTIVYSDFDSSPSGNHIAAKGTVTIQFVVYYTLPNKKQEALVTVAASFKDDDGYTASSTAQVKVAP